MTDHPDPGLGRVLRWFEDQDNTVTRLGAAIRKSLDEVFDGQRTGRYSIEQLGKVEKTYIGAKIEIVVQDEFGLSQGQSMDYVVADEEVDCKWSMRGGGWMIPTEAVGHLCLCLTADDAGSVFSVGVVRTTLDRLRVGQNKDKKSGLSPRGIAAIAWLADGAPLPENLLLTLPPATRFAILDKRLSGQRRVNELFRRVQGRIVRREVLLTVAQQDDGPKRARDARHQLREEGILILGHQQRHPLIARELGLEVPGKGEWISCRVVPTTTNENGSVGVSGSCWRLAGEGDAVHSGPRGY